MSNSLETERLILREWCKEDSEDFARINSDAMVMEYMPRLMTPQDSEKLVRRFEKHFKDHGFGMWAVERKEDGAFIGTVGLNTVEFKAPFAPAVEVAWRLDYGYWGHGYATEAAARALEHAFTDLKLKEIVAFTVHDNTKAVHIMEKLGMARDPKGDFDYPTLPKGHPVGQFILYRLKAKEYKRG